MTRLNVNNTPLKAFDERVVQFLGDLSTELLKSPLVRQYPDLSAFAFYVRKANLSKLQEQLKLESMPDTVTKKIYSQQGC